MILGIGTDILDIRRVETVMAKRAGRFIERCYTDAERARAEKITLESVRVRFFAKRYAAKEAVIKAIGVGATSGVTMDMIEILNDDAGKPFVTLKDTAQSALLSRTPKGHATKIHLSISDEPPYVLAYCIIESG